ncbi:MAG: ESPR domain-containing protein, partial [Aquincola sp.]|nr:ESPR domain-containing protein [Aquincola sp.]
MNRIYRIVWNEAQGAWVAVNEIAKGQGPRALLSARRLRRLGLAALAATGAAAL